MSPTEQRENDRVAETACEYAFQPPKEVTSHDPDVLRAALMRESIERRRAECSATMQTDVVKLALDLLVREPDIEGFFGGLARMMVDESESHTCAVWLLDEKNQQCALWLAYVKDRLYTAPKDGYTGEEKAAKMAFLQAMAAHLFEYKPGWSRTIEYPAADERLPQAIRDFGCEMNWQSTVATPLQLGTKTLGWVTVCSGNRSDAHSNWGRVVMIEAIARQAALALHHSR